MKQLCVIDWRGWSRERKLPTRRWLEQIASVGSVIHLNLDESGEHAGQFSRTASSWPAACETAYAEGSYIVLITPDQMFFDSEIVRNAISRCTHKFDYFTQWEHAQLPLGIGARVLNPSNEVIRGWEGTPDALIEALKSDPERFTLKYDDMNYLYSRARNLDGRIRTREQYEWILSAENVDQSLSGFLSVVENAPRHLFLPVTSEETGLVDNHGMRATYGFESFDAASFPGYVMFDITNVCNSRCRHCPHSLSEFRKNLKPRYLDPMLFRRVIDEIPVDYEGFIRITADGEPLLHKGLEGMLSYADKQSKGRVGLTTNGALMDPERSRAILDTGVSVVDFSLDALDEETYADIRQGLPFKEVLENIFNFLELREKNGLTTRTMVSFVKQERNRAEAEAFEQFWRDKVDKVLIREFITNVNAVHDPENENCRVRENRWPCPHVFRRVVVNYEGNLKICPVDWENRTVIGSLESGTVRDIWQGEAYRRIRLNHLNNRFPADSACGGCPDWRGSPWQLGYEKVIRTLDP